MKARRSNTSVARVTVGYARVSTADQAEGVSIATQEARIAQYCDVMGWAMSEVIADPGASAKALTRPGMTRLLDMVRSNRVDRIVVSRLDRLTRSTRDLADLLDLFTKHGVSLVSIAETLDTGSAGGRMVLNLLGVLAQWSREVIAENTSHALGHMRRSGKAYSKTPFGYRRDGADLVIHPEEQKARNVAISMDRNGASFREIGRYLGDVTGKTWGPSSVRAMLRSRMTQEMAA